MYQQKTKRPAGAGRHALAGVGNKRHTHSNTSEPVYNGRGKVVGYINGPLLTKQADSIRHMLKQPPGWAWDVAILDHAKGRGVTHTEVTDTETGITYRAAIADFETFGAPINRGHGPQIVLPAGYWSQWRNGQRLAQPLHEGQQQQPAGARQLGLFEVIP